MCDNKELLIGYVYDDLTADERTTFAAHLHSCSDCRDEVAALAATRGHLAAWAPPAPDLGFQIVRHAVEQRPKVLPFRSKWIPAMGFAAAAVLVLAAASAIANLEVRYGSDGLVVRTGWARSDSPSAPATAQGPVTSPVSLTNASADFALVEQRLRRLEAAITAQPATTAARMSDMEMLRQVRDIVKEAESRQNVAVAQRLLEVIQDFDRRARTDYAMLQQSNAQYQGATQAELLTIKERLRATQLEK